MRAMMFWRKSPASLFALSLLLSFVVFSWTPSAFADSAAQARYHDEKARAFFSERKYESAVQEFFIVQRTAPTTSTLYNIALCFQHLDRTEDEFNYLQEYLAGADSKDERHGLATARVKKLTPKVARVLVESTPPGAWIYLDREELGSFGRTPAVVALSPGEHRVIVRREGYRKSEQEIDIQSGKQASAALKMELIVGTARIIAPAGATVRLRSSKGAEAAAGEAPFEAKLPPGDYRVTVEAQGYKKYRGLLAIADSSTSELTPELEKQPPPTGDLTITSNVPGALVTLDGQAAGFAPLTLSNILEGKHLVGMSKPGHLPWEGAVRIEDNEQSWLTSTLETPVRKSIPTWAVWTTGSLGAASLLSAGVFGILTATTHSQYQDDPSDELKSRGTDYALVADVCLISGVVLATTAIIFYAINGPQEQRKSTATFSGATQ